MKFYQVLMKYKKFPKYGPTFSYWSNKREATRAANRWMDVDRGSTSAAITVIEVEATRKGILAALQKYAGQDMPNYHALVDEGEISEDDIGADRPG